MPRQNAALDLVLSPREAGTTASRWLYGALRSAILEGRLRPGARLPATRELARRYGVSRGTVVDAFSMLESEGYLRGRMGSGTYVAAELPDRLLEAGKSPRQPPGQFQRPVRHLSEFTARVPRLGGLESAKLRAFRRYLPALDLFPITLWTQVAARRLRRATVQDLAGCSPLGYLPLREAIAEYLTTSRGTRCTADHVAVVSGVQEALDLVARLVLDPDARVGVEDPGYSGARAVFEAHGAGIVPIPVDAEGLTLPRQALKGVRLVYVTPAHQYPLGMTMSLARRLALLEWAHACGGLIFEDDYDSEYRYRGKPVPSLQGLDRFGQVIFAGTFSKVLFPSIRLGYLVLPADLVDRVAALLSVSSRHAPLLDQAVLADFMAGGHFGRHVRRMREVYADRLGVLLDHGRQFLQGVLDISSVEAGLQTVGWLGAGVDSEAIVRAAGGRQVDLASVQYYGDGADQRPGLQLGFAAVDAPEIRRGVRVLAEILGGRVS